MSTVTIVLLVILVILLGVLVDLYLIGKKEKKSRYISVILCGVADMILVAGGYFIFEYFIYGIGAAASIPANLIQGLGGLVISLLLYPALMAVPDLAQCTQNN